MQPIRKALVVGVNHYEHCGELYGCVRDAVSVAAALERHHDGKLNFDTMLRTASSRGDAMSSVELRELIEELFSGKTEIALFYFAGHGHVTSTGGYLALSDCRSVHDGVPLAELLDLASQSKADNKVIILDSCFSGSIGKFPGAGEQVLLGHGVTIVAASKQDQYAHEKDGHGVFTDLFLDALDGSAANILGSVTPASVYAHIDRSLGSWAQRPVFMSNIERFVSLKEVQPLLSHGDLSQIVELFPHRGYEHPLDPSYEPTSDSAIPEHTRKFAVLQRYNRVGLMVPVGAEHPYYAAMQSKACRLTATGEHYRELVAQRRV